MLPRLIAEESFQMRDRVAMGTGALERRDARRLAEDWRRAMTGGRRQRPAKASPDALAGMGIAVTVDG